MSTQQNAEEIQSIRDTLETINKRLASGVTQVSTDGTTTTVSLQHLERERIRLERKLAGLTQPVAATVDLSHG